MDAQELPCSFGMGLFQPPSPLDFEAQLTETLAFAASIDEDGTILERAIRIRKILIHCEIAMQRHDQRKEQLVFSHARLALAIINGCGL